MQHTRPSVQLVGLTLFLVLGCLNGQDAPNTGGVPPVRSAPPTTATPTNDTYNLRGTPVQGTTRRTELAFDLQDAQLTMKVGEAALSGVMSMKSETTEDLEILEVGDGLVRKGRLHHVLDRATNTTRIKLPDGTEHSEPTEDLGALHGRVETIECSGGQWKRTLEGPPPTPEQALELTGPPIDDAMYPTAIKVGESWTETGPELRRWLTSDVLSVRGEVKNTLIAVESQQGEQVAVIESAGEAEATIVDADNNELTMTLGLQGTMRRSLDRGIDLEGAAAGTAKIAGDVVEDGVTMSLTVTGRYSAKFQGRLR